MVVVEIVEGTSRTSAHRFNVSILTRHTAKLLLPQLN